MAEGDWLAGRTGRGRNGRTVRIAQDPYVNRDAVVLIDGKPAEVLACRRMRDGGSTTIVTDRGTIYVNARLGSEPWAKLDGRLLK